MIGPAHATDPPPRPSIVVAFKKGVTAERAAEVMKRLGLPFHSGSDSSRGKQFFYSHGPQYLVEAAPAEQRAYLDRAKKERDVAEAWLADWKTQKD
jgi:hypothetical protein